MTIIICGLPKTEEEAYRCPYCGFTSFDIEQFAVSMCWECVFPIEKTMTDIYYEVTHGGDWPEDP
jgi:protein-arginine kinase activator protein McsA